MSCGDSAWKINIFLNFFINTFYYDFKFPPLRTVKIQVTARQEKEETTVQADGNREKTLSSAGEKARSIVLQKYIFIVIFFHISHINFIVKFSGIKSDKQSNLL